MPSWSHNHSRVALLAVVFGVAVVAAGTAGTLAGREPFATWYYVFAWYGTLLAVDGAVALARPHPDGLVLLGRPARLAALLGWSVVAWLFFELLNLRLQNWYYVFVPHNPVARWVGITLSFATVLPAVFLSEASLDIAGVGRNVRSRPLRVTPRLLAAVQGTGFLMLALLLLWPQYFFPLAWGFVTLILEPANYRREPDRSLLADLERGRPGRILRLLLGGAVIGLLWEMFNIEARGKWIYTVPGFEELKLFEMPLLGFLGFPPFALECFAIWQALVLAGLAVPWTEGVESASRTRKVTSTLSAVLFSVGILLAMERYTISSHTPRLSQLPGISASGRLERAGYDVFSLAEATPAEVHMAAGLSESAARKAVRIARLVTLRGIGTENARWLIEAGVSSVESLASADSEALTERLNAMRERDIPHARVQVWIRGAREEEEPDA